MTGSPPPIGPIVLGIDPGSAKCGLAVVAQGHADPLARMIVDRRDVEARIAALIVAHRVTVLALGNGTSSTELRRKIGGGAVPLVDVDERNTTLAARARYFRAHPPRGWRRFIPRSLLTPPEPIDDWAAAIIAERYLALSGC